MADLESLIAERESLERIVYSRGGVDEIAAAQVRLIEVERLIAEATPSVVVPSFKGEPAVIVPTESTTVEAALPPRRSRTWVALAAVAALLLVVGSFSLGRAATPSATPSLAPTSSPSVPSFTSTAPPFSPPVSAGAGTTGVGSAPDFNVVDELAIFDRPVQKIDDPRVKLPDQFKRASVRMLGSLGAPSTGEIAESYVMRDATGQACLMMVTEHPKPAIAAIGCATDEGFAYAGIQVYWLQNGTLYSQIWSNTGTGSSIFGT